MPRRFFLSWLRLGGQRHCCRPVVDRVLADPRRPGPILSMFALIEPFPTGLCPSHGEVVLLTRPSTPSDVPTRANRRNPPPPESTEDHARELAFPESTCSQK